MPCPHALSPGDHTTDEETGVSFDEPAPRSGLPFELANEVYVVGRSGSSPGREDVPYRP